MRERRSATLPLPVLPAGLGLAGLGAGSGSAALAFLACGESRGLGTRAAGGGLWVGAAGAGLGLLGLSGVALSCFGFAGGVNISLSSLSSLSAQLSTSIGAHVTHALGLEFGAGTELPGQGGL